MNDSATDKLVADLLTTFSFLHRWVRQGWRRKRSAKLSLIHYQAIGALMRLGPSPVSEIGRWLNISKPNMTPFVDKLVSEGVVERLPDNKDRRVVNIAITAKGRRLLRARRQTLKGEMSKILAGFTEKDLTRLSHSLETIRAVFLEHESRGKK